MTGLVLKLAPMERILVNGAIIENGDRRAKITIRTPNVNILRLRDAIHPDSVNTPISRVCYIAQLILSGDVELDEGCAQIKYGIADLQSVFPKHEDRVALSRAQADFDSGRIYAALRTLRSLLPSERALLHRGG